MIRIHAGKLKGQTITRPRIESTKETASMVREAVFNSLYNISGDVLDLFAGSGSYGFTAYSLGANHITFNEINSLAHKNLLNNISKLNLRNEVSLFKKDYLLFLKENKVVYDYIFLDPPFDFKDYLSLLNEVSLHSNDNTIIILEIDKKTNVIETFANFVLSKNKTYGSKRIVIYVNRPKL
ncbi:MAG TPA: RsmD family RNA methyltransferase [Haploplasma sp.]|nr:RsmD family RNA methyltransferase [Haploplasma sp.]